MNKRFSFSSLGFGWVIGGFTGIVLIIVIFFAIFSSSTTAPIQSKTTKTTREVALTCTTDMYTQFHIHPHLEIIIDGKEQEIPAHIGITSSCLRSLHTHDNSGIIHVEAQEKRDFTLADFFAVWQKSFNKYQILDYKVDDHHVLKETVNGKEVQDYENTILRDKDQIVVSYEKKQ